MIEHITQCMYNLCSPPWRLVTAVGYVFTDLRIYAPPSPPPAGRPRDTHPRIKTSPASARTQVPGLMTRSFAALTYSYIKLQ